MSPRDKGQRNRKRSRVNAGAVPIWLYLIPLLGIGLRLIAASLLQSSPVLIQPVLEDASYHTAILRLTDRIPAVEEIARGSAFYPHLVGWIPGITEGRPAGLALFQSILEGATLFVLMFWIRRRFGNAAAIGAGLLYAIDPLGGFFAARLSPVIGGTLLFLLAVSLFDRSMKQGAGTIAGLLFGVVTGFGFLLMPLPFLLLAGLAIYRVLSKKVSSAGARYAWSALALAPLLVFGTVQIIQNSSVKDGAPILSWGSGVDIYNAFSPETGGTPRHLEAPSWQAESSLVTECWEALGREGSRADIFRFYATRGFQQAVENPMETVGVLLTKAAGAIGAWPIPDSLSPAFLLDTEARPFLFGLFSFAGLFGLGLAGILTLRSGGSGKTLVLGLLVVALAALLGPNSAAIRQLALPLLAALGGIWIAALRGKLTGNDDTPAGRFASAARSPAVVGILVGGILLSIAAGYLSPTSALRNPGEDLRLLAQGFIQRENWRQAIPLLERSIAADPTNPESRASLARAYQRDGLVDAAGEQLEAGLIDHPDHSGLILGQASLAMARQDPEQAIALMRRLVQLRPRNPLYLNELGQMLLRQGEILTAQPLFVEALRLKPDYRVAQTNLEAIDTYILQLERKLYPEEMRLPPNDPVNQRIPEMLRTMSNGEWETADSLLSVTEQERPDHMISHWFRAAYHARRGDIEQAIVSLKHCDEIAPGRPAVTEMLCGFYLQLGDKESLDRQVARALAAAGDDAERKEAIEQLRTALAEAWTNRGNGGEN